MKLIPLALTFLSQIFALPYAANAADLSVGSVAPDIKAQLQDGSRFDLQSRAGQWTVLFFYPKADTPGCTKQACGFRDNIKKIRDQGADVFGISTDTVDSQAKFHKKHGLNFQLIADPKGEVATAYGAKMPLLKVARRWTFLIDPELKIRAIEKDVDPALDAERIAKRIAELKQ